MTYKGIQSLLIQVLDSRGLLGDDYNNIKSIKISHIQYSITLADPSTGKMDNDDYQPVSNHVRTYSVE